MSEVRIPLAPFAIKQATNLINSKARGGPGPMVSRDEGLMPRCGAACNGAGFRP